MDGFRYTFLAQRVIFGAGAAHALGEACAEAGWQRVLLCATDHAQARGELAPIEAALGERLAATYAGVRPHVPEEQVAEAAALGAAHRVDAIIGLGGGSAIGTAKAVSAALAGPADASPDRPVAAVIAIPTTYAGSEMTPVYGVTRVVEGVPRKLTVTAPRVAPRLTLYDPALTLGLPARVTAGTGINAAAHCVEAVYSITRNPLSTAAALAGLAAIASALPRCHAAGADLAARGEMLTGAFLAGTALSNVTMGLHHGICHVLGGTTGAAHGDVNAIMLPHVMRFNAPATAPELARIAAAMGLDVAGHGDAVAAEMAARLVEDWVERMGLPQRLRAVGIAAERLPDLARLAFASRTVHNNPQPIEDVGRIETLLRQAW
jgi:maleylacetate reductase